MLDNKKTVTNKNMLFAAKDSKLHHIRANPDSDEYLKVWIKEPTWLQVEQALTSVMKMDTKKGSMDIDLNAMYKFCVENFIEKTEPNLNTLDLIRLSPYVGSQLKEILPNPLSDLMGDDEKNEE
jgi:hypothetical protein